jgi:hypothetical protein
MNPIAVFLNIADNFGNKNFCFRFDFSNTTPKNDKEKAL